MVSSPSLSLSLSPYSLQEPLSIPYNLLACRLLPASRLWHGSAVRLSAGRLSWLWTGRVPMQQSICNSRRARGLPDARLRRLLAQSGHLLLDATAAAYTAARQDQGWVSLQSLLLFPSSLLHCALSFLLMKYAIIKADTLSSSWYWSQYRLGYPPATNNSSLTKSAACVRHVAQWLH